MKTYKKIIPLIAAVALCVPLSACGGPVEPIKYEGGTLASGKVGEAYTATVATATGPDVIHYETAAGEWLPEGLDLSDSGVISGIPTEAVENYEFTVVAYADVETPDVEATFTITIQAGEVEVGDTTLANATAYTVYGDNLFADGGYNSDLTYALKEGSTPPAGLKVTEDGFIIGYPTEAVENHTFTVNITGEGYADAEVEYSITVAAATEPSYGDTLSYTGATLPSATVGDVYFGNVGTATGVRGISYARSYIGGVGFPAGLKFDECGLVYGVPTDSANGEDGALTFRVTASAEGAESVRQEFTVNVRDKKVDTTRFEAEYVNLTGKQGAGYSSSPAGKNMIQSFTDASNGGCVGYLLTAESLEFYIDAEAAVTGATLSLCLASEIGNVTFTPNELEISVNGTKLAYGSIAVNGGQQEKGDFQVKVATSSLNLNAGRNEIQIAVKANTLRNGTDTGGPIVDYIEISGTAIKTSWRPKVSNFAGTGV